MQETQKRFVTRRQGVELAKAEGIPLTKSRVDKDAMRGIGPKPAAQFGATKLYTPEAFLRYARALVQPLATSSPESEPHK